MTKELYPLKGIVTTVISPFIGTEKALDVESLHNEIEMACQAGVAGFLVPCLASEQWLLTTSFLSEYDFNARFPRKLSGEVNRFI